MAMFNFSPQAMQQMLAARGINPAAMGGGATAAPPPVDYASYLSRVGYSGGAGDPWAGRGIQRQEKGNSDFDTSVPWTGLQSGGIRDLNHALQTVSGYYTSKRDNKWWGKYFDDWVGKYGKQYNLSAADFTKPADQLTDQQKFGLASMLDTRYRAIEDETAKPPEFLGGFLDKIIKFAGPAVGLLTGNPLLGALAGTLAGAPGKGFNLGAGLLGAAGGAAAGYFSPGLGGAGGASGGAGAAGATAPGSGVTFTPSTFQGAINSLPGAVGTTAAGQLPAIGGLVPATTALGTGLTFTPTNFQGALDALPGKVGTTAAGNLPALPSVGIPQTSAAAGGLLSPGGIPSNLEEILVTAPRDSLNAALEQQLATGVPGYIAPVQSGPTAVYAGTNPGSGPVSLPEALGDLFEGWTPSPTNILQNLGQNALTNTLLGGGTGGTSVTSTAGAAPQQASRGLLELGSPYPGIPRKMPAYYRGLLGV